MNISTLLPSVAVILLMLGILVALIVWKKRRGRPQETNYQAFFILGICFLGMGTVFMTTISPGFIGITGLGVVYMIIGLANRDKWPTSKKNNEL